MRPLDDAGAIDSRIRVVVGDDELITREYLISVLESEDAVTPAVDLVAVCSTGTELRAAIREHQPDVVVTGLRMPPSGMGEGVRIAMQLRCEAPRVGVVVLSHFADPGQVRAILGEGTARRAYLLKGQLRDSQGVVAAIKAVAGGESLIDPKVVDVLIAARASAAQSRLTRLTGREREVLAEIASGKSNAAIADEFVLTRRAVEKHVNSILSKLNLPETETISRRVMAALIYLAETNTTPTAELPSVERAQAARADTREPRDETPPQISRRRTDRTPPRERPRA